MLVTYIIYNYIQYIVYAHICRSRSALIVDLHMRKLVPAVPLITLRSKHAITCNNIAQRQPAVALDRNFRRFHWPIYHCPGLCIAMIAVPWWYSTHANAQMNGMNAYHQMTSTHLNTSVPWRFRVRVEQMLRYPGHVMMARGTWSWDHLLNGWPGIRVEAQAAWNMRNIAQLKDTDWA